jgi:hypothetical protein
MPLRLLRMMRRQEDWFRSQLFHKVNTHRVECNQFVCNKFAVPSHVTPGFNDKYENDRYVQLLHFSTYTQHRLGYKNYRQHWEKL